MRFTPPSSLLSPDVYRLIDSSRRLREALAPDGLFASPYEVLDYDGLLLLQDHKGRKATFKRRQRVRFLQNGVRSVMEHLWGDGLLIEYHNDAGQIADSIRDGKYRHLVIDLKDPAKMGSVLEFNTSRTNLGMFTGEEESWEITVDHPVQRIRQVVAFPAKRPCLEARVEVAGFVRQLEVTQRRRGRTIVSYEIPYPIMNMPYAIRWRW